MGSWVRGPSNASQQSVFQAVRTDVRQACARLLARHTSLINRDLFSAEPRFSFITPYTITLRAAMTNQSMPAVPGDESYLTPCPCQFLWPVLLAFMSNVLSGNQEPSTFLFFLCRCLHLLPYRAEL